MIRDYVAMPYCTMLYCAVIWLHFKAVTNYNFENVTSYTFFEFLCKYISSNSSIRNVRRDDEATREQKAREVTDEFAREVTFSLTFLTI